MKSTNKNLFIKKSVIIFSLLSSFNLNTFAHDASDKVYSDVPASAQKNTSVKSFYKNYCKKKPTVVEFFSYSCPGCFSAEKHFGDYLAERKDKVVFKRVPVIFNRGWDIVAKLYYGYEKMDVVDLFHGKTFVWVQDELRAGNTITSESIEKFINKTITNKDVADKLPETFKVADIIDIINSTTINRDNKKGMRLFRAYGLSTTPSIVVNNKHMITLDKAKTFENVVSAIKELDTEQTDC